MIGRRMQSGAWGDPPNFTSPVAGLNIQALRECTAAAAAAAAADTTGAELC
jgi:hypothetical protein